MQPPQWNDLQDFLVIARAGQLARAAAQLGVDATTIGRRLRRLERRLGQTLFEQTREGQVLTESGEALLISVEAMQRAAERISERPDGQPLSGLLRVSVSEGFGTWFIASHLHDFVDLYPGLTVDLVATSGFLSPSKRETDVAVLLARPQVGPVVSSKLSDYRLRLYGGEAYLARHGTPRTTAEGRTTLPPWDAPEDVSERVAAAGLPMLGAEGQVMHIHAHLDVIVDGRPVAVPANIGIDEENDAISPLHTHDTTGVIHIESPEKTTFTLGQFMTEWDVALDRGRIGGLTTGGGNELHAYVNGREVNGDPAAITLSAHDEIALVYGPHAAAVKVPRGYNWPSGL